MGDWLTYSLADELVLFLGRKKKRIFRSLGQETVYENRRHGIAGYWIQCNGSLSWHAPLTLTLTHIIDCNRGATTPTTTTATATATATTTTIVTITITIAVGIVVAVFTV